MRKNRAAAGAGRLAKMLSDARRRGGRPEGFSGRACLRGKNGLVFKGDFVEWRRPLFSGSRHRCYKIRITPQKCTVEKTKNPSLNL
jgi:hypothetical protein